jgi:hypothetical protein
MRALWVTCLELVAVALAAASCGITARSDDFRCELPGDCADGRVCMDGWCVSVSGPSDAAAPGDAPVGSADGAPGDAAACPAICDSCLRGACQISCDGDGACADLVVCPAGMRCEVHCAGFNACESGVDCSAASACDIVCNQTGACTGPVTCGPGRCDVACNGTASCANGIDCSGSCRCDTDCDGLGACALEPSCPFAECHQGIDCSDTGPDCHQCE